MNVAIVLSNWESGSALSPSRIVQRYCDVLKDSKMISLVSPNVSIPSNIGFWSNGITRRHKNVQNNKKQSELSQARRLNRYWVVLPILELNPSLRSGFKPLHCWVFGPSQTRHCKVFLRIFLLLWFILQKLIIKLPIYHFHH